MKSYLIRYQSISSTNETPIHSQLIEAETPIQAFESVRKLTGGGIDLVDIKLVEDHGTK